MTRKLKLPIPVTILTGALGTGKTTALRHLASLKPPDEEWAVVVNEFGAVGIDAVALGATAAPGLHVRQLAGGCMCCVAQGPLSASLAQIVRAVKPDRLLIEPSGLGHPAGLVDVLQGPHLASALSLRAVVCLVDLTAPHPSCLLEHEIFADQVNIADVVVGSKADAAPPGAVDAFQAWAAALYPPKAAVQVMAHGQLPPALLDAPRGAAHAALLATPRAPVARRAAQQRARRAAVGGGGDGDGDGAAGSAAPAARDDAPAGGAASASGASAGADEAEGGLEEPAPGRPARFEPPLPSEGRSYSACGWVFDQGDVFDRAALLALLRRLQPRVARVKGVFRVGAKQWVMPGTVQPPDNGGAAAGSGASAGAAADGAGGADSAGGLEARLRLQLQLQPVCYRGCSMAEVIVDARRAPAAAPAPDSGGGGGGDSGTPGGAAEDAAAEGVVDAVRAAAQGGDWGGLQRCLECCLMPPMAAPAHPPPPPAAVNG